MILRLKKIALYIAVIAVASFGFTSLAQAFGISPIKILLTVGQSASQTVVFKINNLSASTGETTFKLSVLGVSQDEAGLPVFERGINTAENWVYPESNLVKVKAGEIKSVNFIIKTPENALPGSYYLGLAAEPVQQNSNGGLNSRLVSLLTLQVEGLVNESLGIEKWNLQAGAVANDVWKFDLLLKNNGDIEVPMQAEVAIRNWQGEEIFAEPLVLGNKLLAGSKRALSPEILLKRPVSNDGTGHYSVESNKISLPGLYQAQIRVTYGKTNQSVSAIAYIWYLPLWSKVSAGLFGLVLVVIFVFLIKRKK